MGVLDSSYIKTIGVKSRGHKKIFFILSDTLVHNHRKPSFPMVALPQNHRKTIDPNGCPQPFHSMVMVPLKTIAIQSAMVAKECAQRTRNTKQTTLNLKNEAFYVL